MTASAPEDEGARMERVAQAMRESEHYARAGAAIASLVGARAARLAAVTPEATLREGELALAVILLELGGAMMKRLGGAASAIIIVAKAVKP